jgi:hypothetical protein
LQSASRISFYDEVSRFEIELVCLALKQPDGNQREASRLFRLKSSMLNAKIKPCKIRTYVSDGQPHSVLTLDVTEWRIRATYIVTNPEKLAHLPAAFL